MFKPVPVGDRTRYSYARINEVLPMPHLIDIQRTSYEWFMREGLCEIFHDISPIKDFTGNLELSFEGFTLGEPKYSVEECKERDASYSAPLNVNVRLLYKDTGEIKESKVFMGDFPLMTEKKCMVPPLFQTAAPGSNLKQMLMMLSMPVWTVPGNYLLRFYCAL